MKSRMKRLALCATMLMTLSAVACEDKGGGVFEPTVQVVRGDQQEAIAGQMVSDFLTVQALDNEGHPVPGVPVSWTVTSGGGSLSQVVTTTDAFGRAIAAWTLGTTAGVQSVTATLEGYDQPVVFTATARAPELGT